MTTLDKFKLSPAWDYKYNLPLAPMCNNPWIYLAYATKIITSKESLDRAYSSNIWNQLARCEKLPGLFNRWPDDKGGITSHDELIGIAYLDAHSAQRILKYLSDHWGHYNNQSNEGFFRFNLNRFVFLKPFLKSCAGQPLTTLDKFLWSAYLIVDLITYVSKDEGGRLMRWLMCERMQDIWSTRLWQKRMSERVRGPKEMFKTYLTECEVYYETSPEKF